MKEREEKEEGAADCENNKREGEVLIIPSFSSPERWMTDIM